MIVYDGGEEQCNVCSLSVYVHPSKRRTIIQALGCLLIPWPLTCKRLDRSGSLSLRSRSNPPHTSYQVVKDVAQAQEQNQMENLIITDQQWSAIYTSKRGSYATFQWKNNNTGTRHLLIRYAYNGSLLFIWSAQKQKDFYSLLLLKSARSQRKHKLLYFYYIFEGGQRQPTPLFWNGSVITRLGCFSFISHTSIFQ